MEYTGSISLTDKPTIIPRPFAYTNGTRADIPQSDSGLAANRASYKTGFPPRTSMSLPDGGIPPARFDFNGLGYDVSSWITYFQNGGVVQFDQTVANSIGGYPKNARLWVDTESFGTIVVKAKQNTSVNPSSVLEGILNGTDPNWQIDVIGFNKNVWSSGSFIPGQYSTHDFVIPFDIAVTDGNNHWLPKDNIIVNVYGLSNASNNEWQTLFNQSSFQDDANRRQELGYGIFFTGQKALSFKTLGFYGFYPYVGNGLSWNVPNVSIRVISV